MFEIEGTSITRNYTVAPTEELELRRKLQSTEDKLKDMRKRLAEYTEQLNGYKERSRFLARKNEELRKSNDTLILELARRMDEAVSETDVYTADILRYTPTTLDGIPDLLYGVMGLCGEAGEASELVKKAYWQGHALNTEHLASELGDILWYVTFTANRLGLSLKDIMKINSEKLQKRYPEGHFDAERSQNREEGDI